MFMYIFALFCVYLASLSTENSHDILTTLVRIQVTRFT
jgi:hypothetical protein